MPNTVVGEIEISLIGGRTFILRPSFLGLAEIEARADCGLLNIASEMSRGEVKLKHVAAIIYGGIYGATEGKPEIKFEELGDLLVKSNYVSLVPKVVTWFGKAIQGDPDNQASEKKA